MLADWCCEQAGSVEVKKLWLFDNRLGDEGAAAVARILESHPGMLEVNAGLGRGLRGGCLMLGLLLGLLAPLLPSYTVFCAPTTILSTATGAPVS